MNVVMIRLLAPHIGTGAFRKKWWCSLLMSTPMSLPFWSGIYVLFGFDHHIIISYQFLSYIYIHINSYHIYIYSYQFISYIIYNIYIILLCLFESNDLSHKEYVEPLDLFEVHPREAGSEVKRRSAFIGCS